MNKQYQLVSESLLIEGLSNKLEDLIKTRKLKSEHLPQKIKDNSKKLVEKSDSIIKKTGKQAEINGLIPMAQRMIPASKEKPHLAKAIVFLSMAMAKKNKTNAKTELLNIGSKMKESGKSLRNPWHVLFGILMLAIGISNLSLIITILGAGAAVPGGLVFYTILAFAFAIYDFTL